MWLIYLRFDDRGEVRTYHVSASNREVVDHIMALANQHGLSRHANLVESCSFYARSNIEAKETPNFHLFTAEEFAIRWERAFEV